VLLVPMAWNPFAWALFARLRRAIELDCDGRVLASGAPAVEYGAVLLDVGVRSARVPLAVPALVEPRPFLERRLKMITQRAPRGRWRKGVAAGLAALATFALACDAPTPPRVDDEASEAGTFRVRAVPAQDADALHRTGGEADGPHDGSPVRLRARQGAFEFDPDGASGLSAASGPLIVVDGRVYGPEVLRHVDASAVESVEVVKGAAARALFDDPRAANGVIRITLREGAQVDLHPDRDADAGHPEGHR